MGENIRRLAGALAALFFVVSLGVGYWQIWAAEALNRDPYNPRLVIAALNRPRGEIVDREGVVLAHSVRQPDGTYRRVYASALYEPFLGYATLPFGSAGLEGAYAPALIGEDPADPLAGWRRRYLGEEAPPGSVRLSISNYLQEVAAATLGDRRGAIVALDPRTGEVLASVSVPRYDPNPLVDPARQREAFERLAADESRPLLDRAAQGLYPPGSAFKIVTAAAGLETGAIVPEERVRVESPWQADPSWGAYSVRSPTDARGEFDLDRAMAFSENIYFAMAAVRMGGEALAEHARGFGLGATLALDGPHSRSQVSNTGSLDRPTLVADTGFGQGELLLSPLHMALIAAAVANAGIMPTPHYALEVRDGRGDVLRTIAPGPLAHPLRADTAVRLTQSMVLAVEAPGAFAFGARIPGTLVAGKTGTAENPSGIPHGWFVGFAPAERPTIAVAVLIEAAPRGGLEAAPMGAAVMRAWLAR